jgi:hypothetical protein
MATRKWTDAQRAAQSAAIHAWQPWQHSTGAKSAAGKAIVSRNAYRGGTRPFVRFIGLVYREFGNLDTMTLDRADALKEQCFKLCDEWRAWMSEAEKKVTEKLTATAEHQ